VVTSIRMRREGRLVLAAQDTRDPRAKSTEDKVFGVNDVPSALDLVGADTFRRCKGSISHFGWIPF